MLNTVYLFDSARAENGFGLPKILDLAAKKQLSCGRLLALFCLYDCGLPVRNTDIKKDGVGKPYQDIEPGIHFNLSHKQNISVCIASRKPVGIDIEKSRSYTLDLQKKQFFSESEWVLLNQSKNNVNFFELWTCKESYSKLIGLGLRLPFSSFSVKPDENGFSIDDPIRGKISITTLRYSNEYYISVCAQQKMSYSIKHVNTEKLINVLPYCIS